jgi:hypothetical protein
VVIVTEGANRVETVEGADIDVVVDIEVEVETDVDKDDVDKDDADKGLEGLEPRREKPSIISTRLDAVKERSLVSCC